MIFFTFITITALISGCNIASDPSDVTTDSLSNSTGASPSDSSAVITDSTSDSINASPSESDIIYHEVTYQTGIYHNKDWENGHGRTHDRKVITDSDTAIAFGDIILKNYQSRGAYLDFTLQYVFYDTEDDVYILSYWQYDRGTGWCTTCFSIAINCSNGEVLRMWTQ